MQSKTNDPNWKRILVRAEVPASLQPLQELAQNLWWSWNHTAIELFESIDPVMWSRYQHNPVSLLSSLDMQRFNTLSADAGFMKRMNEVYSEFRGYVDKPKPKNQPQVAYFCMEYGLQN